MDIDQSDLSEKPYHMDTTATNSLIRYKITTSSYLYFKLVRIYIVL